MAELTLLLVLFVATVVLAPARAIHSTTRVWVASLTAPLTLVMQALVTRGVDC